MLLQCYAVLQEIPSLSRYRKHSITSDSLYHLIAVVTYYLSKVKKNRYVVVVDNDDVVVHVHVLVVAAVVFVVVVAAVVFVVVVAAVVFVVVVVAVADDFIVVLGDVVVAILSYFQYP